MKHGSSRREFLAQVSDPLVLGLDQPNEQEWLNLIREYLNHITNVVTSSEQLYRALGGGWKDAGRLSRLR